MATYLYNEGNLLEPSVGDGRLLKYLDINKYNEDFITKKNREKI